VLSFGSVANFSLLLRYYLVRFAQLDKDKWV
jgi:hypothetical protein